jgi:hypothetical protein
MYVVAVVKVVVVNCGGDRSKFKQGSDNTKTDTSYSELLCLPLLTGTKNELTSLLSTGFS